jgi:pSer/pThr/pTyr-binding forkhead associated (FHA) protein
MLTPEEFEQRQARKNASMGVSVSAGFTSQRFSSTSRGVGMPGMVTQQAGGGIPELLLYNDSLNIRFQGINGAVIGRRQGPYTQYFSQNLYVSGVHAQLKYKSESGWSITDKHSSNGTKLNERPLQPDVDMSLKNGDILTVANVILQVSIH